MNAPMMLSEFRQPVPKLRAVALDGLSGLIDIVAERSPPSHRFLRYQWFAAALSAYVGRVRTIVVEADGEPVIALPMIRLGPGLARFAAMPGSYWPFRSFPADATIGQDAFELLIRTLGREVNAMRIGPVCDDDPSAMRLIAAARAGGWTVLDRFIGDNFVLDMDALFDSGRPRTSTLRKNRYLQKTLARHGAIEWQYLTGQKLDGGAFDTLAAIEQRSWIAARTDGSDAKFTTKDHGAFWRSASTDPVIADMLHATVLRVGGEPAAFSFDIDTVDLKYVIANSFDAVFAKSSPGKLLWYHNLDTARADGIRMVDWGAGDSGYKQVIGAEQGAAIRDWLLVRPGLPALLGRMLKRLWERSGVTQKVTH
jgi:CelD/BcsL family acetyltransferase involved in cellulose biosynthesis